MGSSGRALHGASEGIVLLGVGHTGRSFVRRPRASYGWRSAVRTSFVRTAKREVIGSTLVFGQYLQPTFTFNYFSESDLPIFVQLFREAIFYKIYDETTYRMRLRIAITQKFFVPGCADIDSRYLLNLVIPSG